MIDFNCQSCGAKFRVSKEKAGEKGRCPKCGQKLVVPMPKAIEKSHLGGRTRVPMTLAKALQILGLPHKTTLRQAREAYRRLVRQYHPDTGTEKSAAKFIDVVAAYEFLKQYVEGKKAVATVPAVRRGTSIAGTRRPVYGLSYGGFVADLDVSTRETIDLFEREKDVFCERLKSLIDAQVSSYTSASEFRERIRDDVDAVLQRELWSFIERIGRRCELVEEQFRAWVERIRRSAYEVGLPHSLMEYLSRPGGVILSSAIFLVLVSAAYLAMFMSHLPFFESGPVPILAGILAAGTAGLISLWGGMAIYTGSARRRGVHERAVLMSQVGLDSFKVGAMPVSEALSSGGRAGLAGAGVGGLMILLNVEPITGLCAAGLAALWGWLTGKSLSHMKKKAKEDIQTALEPRLEDFFDGFAHKFLKFNDLRLQRMRKLYIVAFGPDDNPILQRRAVLRPRLGAPLPSEYSSAARQGAGDTSFDEGSRDALLGRIREIVGGHSKTKLYVAPNIPEEKLNNAVDSYAQGTNPREVLFLYDSTVFGSAKNGFCLAIACLFWRNEDEEAKRLDIHRAGAVRVRKAKSFLGAPRVEVGGHQIAAADDETAGIIARVIRAAKSPGWR